MNNIITEPGPTRLVRMTSAAVPNAGATIATTVMTFESIRSLLSPKPLRTPVRGLPAKRPAAVSESIAETASILADKDTMTAIAASGAQLSQGRLVRWGDLKRELGL